MAEPPFFLVSSSPRPLMLRAYLLNRHGGGRQEYLAHVRAEVRAENEMVEEFVREQMGISSIVEVRPQCCNPDHPSLLSCIVAHR